jgi:hypothetical protein
VVIVGQTGDPPNVLVVYTAWPWEPGRSASGRKIVQQAVVTVLNEIYETDFRGFSYGFRPGRNAHEALDALNAGLQKKRVNWILDTDMKGFLDSASYCPLIHESSSNSAGC